MLIFAGFLVMSPSERLSASISRWIGILAAAIGAITAISWMLYYPVWSFIYIGIGVMVIYGLSAHFGEQVSTS